MKTFSILAGLLVASFACQARADMVDVTFSGGTVSGSLRLTYGSATDETYPDAFELTGISGKVSDSSLGLVDAAVTSLVAITRDTPEPGNLLAPKDFSRFFVTTGLEHGSLSYDNLFWPGGSPQTATDYPFHGGFLDIYGLLFNIEGGMVVNLWSNGVTPGSSAVDYGVAIVTPERALNYVGGGVTARAVPEPGTLALLGIGLAGVLARRRNRAG